MRVIFLCLICLLAAFALAQEPRVSWFDDFIGVRINPAYCVTLAGNGVIQVASGPPGGVILLAAMGYGPGAARLRLGEDPGTGPFNALNFSAQKNLVYKARVFLNRNTHVDATVGLVGLNDPQNVLALIYQSREGAAEWGFQVVNAGRGTTHFTGFTHQPGFWFTVRIEAGETAKVYFNDEAEPRVEVPGEFIPVTGLCAEFQIWNKAVDGAHSQPTMWADYLSVSQDR